MSNYANGSYYDPETGLYIDADDISTIVDRALGGHALDRTSLLCNNTLELDGLPFGVYTVADLSPDPDYNDTRDKTWLTKAFDWIFGIAQRVSAWYRNIPRWIKVVAGITCLVAAIALTVATGGWGGAVLLLKQFVFNVLFGAAISATMQWLTHGAVRSDEVLDSLADGILWAGVFAFVAATVNTIKAAGRAGSVASSGTDGSKGCSSSNCFREGTLVETEHGLVAIESIEVGDKVLAFDHETGKQAYKKVTRLFRNKTDTWYHVYVNEQDIACTAGHPFYVASLETFVAAKDLKVGQAVLLADGTCAFIDEIRIHKLRVPQITYNFEVEDFHTYYVTDEMVLVHNKCVAREGNLRADVKVGGDPNHKIGHAHIYECGENIASIYENGTVAAGKLTPKAAKFVSKHLKEIEEGIRTLYYIGRG